MRFGNDRIGQRLFADLVEARREAQRKISETEAEAERAQREASERIEEAERGTPAFFRRNGWVVGAFQASWAAIAGVMPLPEDKFAQRDTLVAALESAARAGYDTDTITCLTGALMGAALGPKAVPPDWRRTLFGWPSYEVAELTGLVQRVIAPMVRDGEKAS